ncbi:MAG: DUF4440 domain-containing protein [Candidatus Kryptoniota bacterium]
MSAGSFGSALPGSLQEQIRLLEECLLLPGVRSNAEELVSLIADDFVEFGSSGLVYNKEQVLEGLIHVPSLGIIMENFQVKQLASNIVLATYRAVKRDDAKLTTMQSLRSSIWRRSDGRWQIVFHQGTMK